MDINKLESQQAYPIRYCSKQEECPACHGTGYIDTSNTDYEVCKDCEGDGNIIVKWME